MRHSPLACLATLAALTACDASRGEWDAARTANTRQAYERFLERHPTGERAERARAALASISAAEETRRRQLAEAEAKKARAAAALKTATRQETIPAFRRIERDFPGTPEAEEAGQAIAKLRAARRADVRQVTRVAVVVDSPAALAGVPIAKAAEEILALAGVVGAPTADDADATLRISLRESSQTATYRPTEGSSGKAIELPTGATVTGDLRFEVRGGAKVSRPFNGRVERAFLVWVPERSAKQPPPYFEAAGLAHQTSRREDVVEPASTFSVRLVQLTAELFGAPVQRAALIEPSPFRWAVLRSMTSRTDPRTVDALLDLLPDAGADHEFVVEALGRSGDPRAVPALLDLVGRDGGDSVVQALGRLKDRRAVMPLVELLERHLAQARSEPRNPDLDPDHHPEAEVIADALESITGRNFGANAAAWRKWAQQAARR